MPAFGRRPFRELIQKNKQGDKTILCLFFRIKSRNTAQRAVGEPCDCARRLFCVFSVASVASESNHPSRTFGNSVMRMFVHP